MSLLESAFSKVFTAQRFIIFLESIIVTVAVCAVINGIIMPFFKKKRKKRAINNGHYLTAYRTRFIYNPEGITHKAHEYTGIFHYEYKHRNYKCSFYYDDLPPEEITLYFANNPRKAKPDEQFGYLENERYLVFVIVFAFMEVLEISLF